MTQQHSVAGAEISRSPVRPPPSLERSGAVALTFGRFTLLKRTRELLVDGAPAPLGGRCLEVLMALVEADGDLVTKDELFARVWPGQFVEENCLQFHVSMLRKAFGADRDFIQTVSGRGYRFMAEVTRLAAAPRRSSGQSLLQRTRQVDPPRNGATGNLPRFGSELIGREQALREIEALVSKRRLVTLVGRGGGGKTRLATEFAHRRRMDYPGGVWIADLGALTTAIEVATSVAAILRPDEMAPAPRLLVLDGCEHLVEAVAGFAEDLLQANPFLSIMATSQQPLRAEGEWLFRTPPLAAPAESACTAAELLGNDAVKLFTTRLCAAQPGLALNDGELAEVGRICRRLEGLPLAIELAAASAAVLGVRGLASQVDVRIDLLVHGRRTAPPRHQSLRATLDWSVGLLTDHEHRVMRLLASCSAGFTIEDAGAVASGEMEAQDVLLGIAGLVSKSLLVRDDDPPGPRFRVPEILRRYLGEGSSGRERATA